MSAKVPSAHTGMTTATRKNGMPSGTETGAKPSNSRMIPSSAIRSAAT